MFQNMWKVMSPIRILPQNGDLCDCFGIQYCPYLFWLSSVLIFLPHITWILAVCDFDPFLPGRAEEGAVCVKQEHEEVEWCCCLWNNLVHVILNCLINNVLVVISNALQFTFYICPQLIKDADYKSSVVFGFGPADVKKECSLDHSRHNHNEGNSFL